MSSSLIELRKLSKIYQSYGKQYHALSEVNLSIEACQKVCFTGPSGAGKTTLLRMMCRFDQPTHGTVLIAGQNLTELNLAQLASFRQQIAFVPQSPLLLNHYSVLDNVLLTQQPNRGVDYQKARDFARSALDRVGMLNYQNHSPASLSLGQQQLIALARAIAKRPMLIIADEPTGNLDPSLSHTVMRLLRDYNEQVKTTVIVATHEESLVREEFMHAGYSHFYINQGVVKLDRCHD